MKTRLRKVNPERKKGQYQKKCQSILHRSNDSRLVNLKSKKDVKRNLVQYVRKNKLVINRRGNICLECIRVVQTQMSKSNNVDAILDTSDTESDHSTTFSANEEVNIFKNILRQSSSDMGQGCSQSFFITDMGSSPQHQINDWHNLLHINTLIEKDITKLFKNKSCSSVEKVVTYSPVQWLDERPTEIVNFFSKLCAKNPRESNDAFFIAKLIEQVYGLRNSRLVLPLSFRHNLVSYSLSGSKDLLRLNSSTFPSGSYTFVCNWLSDNAKNQILFPEGTVRVVFDNEQVVGKRYVVSLENPNVPISVVTSHAYLQMEKMVPYRCHPIFRQNTGCLNH